MDLIKLKEPLSIEDIDFRVQSVNKSGYATILAYKDARVDMNRLDNVCGASNWQRDHKEVKGVVYCGIGILLDISNAHPLHWIWKWDAGTESFTEKQKGEASDSFKRAGFNWGIGRELYDYPVIKTKLFANEFNVDNNGKVKQTWDLKLKDWVWSSEFEDGELTILKAVDNKGVLRFDFHTKTVQTPQQIPTPKRLTAKQVKAIPTSDVLESLETVLKTYTLQPSEKKAIEKRINELS